MKNTVKSLLITTVLTLPTVFGAESLPASDPLTDDSAQEPSSLICVAAGTQDARSQSTLAQVPEEVLQIIIGVVGESEVFLGFLSPQDLSECAQISSKFRDITQPMLSWIKNWRQTVIPRLLKTAPIILQDADKQALIFLRTKPDIPANTPTGAAFITILNIAVAVKLWKSSGASDERTVLVAVIDNYGKLSPRHKNILKLLLPNASSNNILMAADKLKALGDDFHPKAAALYEKAANHTEANPNYIRLAAAELKALGSDYHPKAAELYVKSAAKESKPNNIRLAADELKALGPQYHDKAAKLYEAAANHDAKRYEAAANHADSTFEGIRSAAIRLSLLGSAYFGKAVEILYIKAKTRKDATPDDIRMAANGLIPLGSQYYPKAAELYETSATHNDATCDNIRSAAKGLQALGSKYYPKAAELYEKAATHPKATPDDILMATNELTELGYKPKDTDPGADLYARAAKDPNASPMDLLKAGNGFKDLGYQTAAAELFEKAANHRDATCNNIRSAALRLNALGPKYYAIAAELFEKSANHQKATSTDILSAANGLNSLGGEHAYTALKLFEKAAELNIKAATREDATPDDILRAANGLKDLASVYPENSNERIQYNDMADEILRTRGLSM